MANDRSWYRSKVLASPSKRRSKLVSVDINGETVEFEVRAPTIAEDSDIQEAARKIVFNQHRPNDLPKVTISGTELSVQSAIACVYIPGSTERVFEAADAEALRNAPIGSWYETLCNESLSIRRVDAETVEKNS